jgi:hypothetical protein
MAVKDPFEADLEALFAKPVGFSDADAFAAAVERRLEPPPAAALSPAVRGGLIGAAAAVGAMIAFRGLSALSAPALGALDQAQTVLGRLPANLQSIAGGALDPTILWAAIGLSVIAVVLYGPSQEI